MLVNGVDISMLEGWMLKINNSPSLFGRSMNRRWFKVGFVAASGSEKKLVISYSTTKTAKDPRGWLYVEDVSNVYCRRDMIEIVSPSRTLRLKGETTVEHRLWSDSLYKLCTPPAAEKSQDNSQRETKQEREIRNDQQRSNESDESEDERHSFSKYQKEENSRSSRDEEKKEQMLSPSSDSSDDDSEEENRESSRPSTNTRSLLVAQIKAGSSFRSEAKSYFSDSEEESSNEQESPREPMTSTSSIEDVVPCNVEKLDSNSEKIELQDSSLSYFNPEAVVSTIQANNNFVHDDWDEEEELSTSVKMLATSAIGTGRVTADTNFVHEDWDD